MSYPGNPSLADEIQKKILDTFLQTLDLAETGKKEEALLGCDFIRRLDPLFEPAETLLERLETQQGPVPVDDLRAQLPGADRDAGQADGAAAGDLAAREPTREGSRLDATSEEIDELFAEIEGPEEAHGETAAETAAGSVAAGAGAAPDDAEEAAPDTDSEPAAALDRESEERVEQLLAEGQEAFSQAEYQSAIDAWSRIFLIDIDHPEANRRIELARKLKAEVERKVEESYHDALTALEAGNLELAAGGFRKVLKLQPGHLAAQEHLDRLTAGDFVPEPDGPEDAAVADVGAPDAQTVLEEPGGDDIAEGDFGFEPLAPPPGSETPRAPATEPARQAAPRRPSRRTVFVIAGLVLVVAVGVAWLLRSNWTRLFPNAGEEVAAPQRPRVDPIVRAQGLHMGGNTAMAISQLRRLPPAHPKYAEAQALIAQWETVLEGSADEEPSEGDLSERDRLVALARESFANRKFLSAEELFARASQAAPLDEGAEALRLRTVEKLEPLRSEIEIFRQGEWEYALRSLWRKYEEEPGNPDITRLMVDAYFNLGVRELQRGDPASAAKNLEEAASLAGNDPEIRRLLDFARIYNQRPPDLQYRIFVKYLPFR